MTNPCYVFAVTSRGAPVPATRGINRARLFVIPAKDVQAIVCSVSQDSLTPSAEMVLKHETVVETIRAAAPAIPTRFGTVLPDAEAVVRVLEERNDILAADVARIGDKVEFGLTALWRDVVDTTAPISEPTSTDYASPGDYLRTRFDDYRREDAERERARAVASDVAERLTPYVREQRSDVALGGRLVLRAAYLVEPAASDALRAAFEEARQSHPECSFLLSGPWPPYSFVSPESGSGRMGQAGVVSLLRGMGVAE